MSKLCDEGNRQNHSRSSRSRRDFFKATAAAGVAAAGFNPFAARPAAADGGDPPADSGQPGRRYVIRGVSGMSLGPNVGGFPQAHVLVEGKKNPNGRPDPKAGSAPAIHGPAGIVMPRRTR